MLHKVIETQNLSFSYNGEEVLKGIDFSIQKGSMVGVIGANGAGKSTLLKLLLGILRPKNGRVLYQGKELKKLDKREVARKIAYIPQNSTFWFPFTVKEVVLMGRAPYLGRFEFETEEDLRVALRAMETVGIKHLGERLVSEISGGEKQLVSLARALAQEPEVMILDEPATFLDVKNKTEIMKLLKKLKEEKGIAIIAATHDVFSGLFYFDKILMLKDGGVFACGDTIEVLKEESLAEVYGIDVGVRWEDGKIFVFPKE